MQAAGVCVAGELEPLLRDHFSFSLTTWPYGAERGRDWTGPFAREILGRS